MNNVELLIPIFPILYAEFHHTLKGFSLVHKKWPEILSDAPYRVEPDQPIPLLLLIKDAHQYPIDLQSIHGEILYPDASIEHYALVEETIHIKEPWWFQIHHIHPRKDFHGQLRIRVRFDIRQKGKQKIHHVFIDNYRGSSHLPLDVYVAKDPFPHFENWYFGDLHYHTNFTNDQVEFGAPLQGTAEMAKSTGLSFVAATDHAYDLDDMEGDYLHADPELTKWHHLHQTIQQIEREDGFIFIPGEEVTCENRKGKNIHCLLLNNEQFFPGSGDSAERLFRTKSESSAFEILDELNENSLAYAAHPEHAFTILHRLLLHRGKWNQDDYEHPRLNGLQILNGTSDRAFRRGIQKWILLLLEGKKMSIVAGNDAHGNFNRFRQLGLPFLYFKERMIHVFGQFRTAVFVQGKISRKKILNALKNGKNVITTGPALLLELENQNGEKAAMGDSLPGKVSKLSIQARSTEEFGHLHSCKIWLGYLKEKRENLFKEVIQFENNYEFTLESNLGTLPLPSYIRGELTTEKKGQTFFCLTNPIWIQAER